jgi:hypothetical protein
MRSLLVDHATLRSAHSVLYGRTIPEPFYRASYEDEIDISCLANLIENIILFDEIVVPGVPHVHSERLSSAFGSAVSFRPLDPKLFNSIEQEACGWLRSVDNPHSALNLMNLALDTFDDGSDCYALTAIYRFAYPDGKASGRVDTFKRQYSPNAITDYTEQYETLGVPLGAETIQSIIAKLDIDSLRKSVAKKDEWITHDFLGVAAIRSVYWGLLRSRCYDLISRELSINYSPHLLRSDATAFSRLSDRKQKVGLGVNPIEVDPYMRALKNAHDHGREFVEEQTGIKMLGLNYSPLFHYVLSKIDKKEQILSATYDVRHARDAIALRGRLMDVDEAVREGNLKETVKIAKEVDRLSRVFATELGANVSGLGCSISVLFMSVNVPNKITGIIQAEIDAQLNRHFLFLRNVFRELNSTARLGKYHEILTSQSQQPIKINDLPPTEGELVYQAAAALDASEQSPEANRRVARLIQARSPGLSLQDALEVVRKAWAILWPE